MRERVIQQAIRLGLIPGITLKNLNIFSLNVDSFHFYWAQNFQNEEKDLCYASVLI